MSFRVVGARLCSIDRDKGSDCSTGSGNFGGGYGAASNRDAQSYNILSRDVIYTFRAYAMMPVRLSVCPSVCEGSALAHYS